MTYSPDVHAFQQVDVYVCESEVQRTKPFVIPQFETSKALAVPGDFDKVADLYARSQYGGIQIDDPIPSAASTRRFKAAETAGAHRLTLLASYIRVHNKIVHNLSADPTLALHLCRGNFQGQRFGAAAANASPVEQGRCPWDDEVRGAASSSTYKMPRTSARRESLNADSARLSTIYGWICISRKCGFATHNSRERIGEKIK
ncbi:hypothetical protein L226DRAFT_576052 [Lentinus tigrinus ALCF2SS1-7]|uniref:Uncharacterized protein n=1 Tax=Lentinus tigrinus ALCF2SS1-6 TaxID=1328759 RepID=A0A5C2RR33_9APHY|nr:hypothetical protein L227DRAFT_616447 [Lentinus tigrinus ALCF2SS1-6]RPD68873.1 hypothetical protein L226DRAFT_576052 [Lentinus tigrinus ALCF2SS1-7]